MSKIARVLTLAFTTAALVFSAQFAAHAARQSYSKTWIGLGGSLACELQPYLGQTYPTQPGTHYQVKVRLLVGEGTAQACISFKTENRWTAPAIFINEYEGQVPPGAYEASVAVTHTDPEVSYGAVIVPAPTTIEYTDGIEN